MRLLAVDPGEKGLALAYFDEAFRQGAVFSVNGESLSALCASAVAQAEGFAPLFIDVVAVEQMVFYPRKDSGAAQAGKVKALLELQAIGSAVAWRLAADSVRYCPASLWKGQISKRLTQARIQERLSPGESAAAKRDTARYGARGHNLWDAIGIGLYALGRF